MTESAENKVFLAEIDVLNWSNQLADALTYLHQQNPPILHRDIKPSNLKLTPTGVLKLVDFGLVKLLAPGEVTITILQGREQPSILLSNNMAAIQVIPMLAATSFRSDPRCIIC